MKNFLNLKRLAISVGVIVVIVGVALFVSKAKNTGNNSVAKNSSQQGYALNSRESAVLNAMLNNETANFLAGNYSVLHDGLVSASVSEIEKAYVRNSATAEKTYLHKMLALRGQVDGIDSGSDHEIYITLRGANRFTAAQARFNKTNVEKISALKKAQPINLVCEGAGSVRGILRFKDCHFADDYAAQKVSQLKTEIADFLKGEKVSSEAPVLISVMAITLARTLPDTSTCFSDGSKCMAEISALLNSNDANLTPKIIAVAAELKSRGVQVPESLTHN